MLSLVVCQAEGHKPRVLAVYLLELCWLLTSPAEKMDLSTPGVLLLLLLAVAALLAGAGSARTERAAAAALVLLAPASFRPAGRTAAAYVNRPNLKNAEDTCCCQSCSSAASVCQLRQTAWQMAKARLQL
jgi:hypothetical protein